MDAIHRAGCEDFETVSNVKVILNSPKFNLFLLRETWNLNLFFSDELIVLSASGTAACVDLHLATSGALQGILCM